MGIHLRKTHEKFLFEAGTDKYRGLILQVNRRQREYEYYDDIITGVTLPASPIFSTLKNFH